MVRYLVDSAEHLGQFFLVAESTTEGEETIRLEGPDGQLFGPSELLPVLARNGKPVRLKGSDLVLVWLVDPRRQRAEIRMGLRYLAQWPEGPQAKMSCW
jgi:hypothetical protein